MPQDLPPQTAIINNTNQSGGTNIGIQNIFTNQPTKPREISKEQADTLKKLALGNPRLTIFFTIDPNVPDALKYAQALSNALAQAGYDIFPNADSMSSTPPIEDIVVTSNLPNSDACKNFIAILRKADIKITEPVGSSVKLGNTQWGARPKPPGITIEVGRPSQ